MPNLSELTDYNLIQPEEELKPLTKVYIGPKSEPDSVGIGTTASKLADKLLGLNGQERYQLWPEKVVREALSAAGDAYTQGTVQPGLRREDYTDIPAPMVPTQDSTALGKFLNVAPVAASPQDTVIGQAQAISALAGTSG